MSTDKNLSAQHVAAAAEKASARLLGRVRATPLQYSPHFSAETGAEVWFKLENFQETGSFKLRGAFNRLLTLDEAQRQAGCVTASSGNHGAAVACASQRLGIRCTIFVPQQASPAKVAAIRGWGGDVRLFGDDGLDTEQHARQYAKQNQRFYISPYNDAEVIAGQGSCGVEILRELPDIDCLLIAVGGGGLISGCGSVLKVMRPQATLIGCQPARSAVMARSVAAGEILPLPSEPTLSDGTAGGIEAGAITFEPCRQLVDEFCEIPEESIASAMREYIEHEHQLIEGAAGVAVAGLRHSRSAIVGKKVVVLICGANISRQDLTSVLA